MKKQVGYDSFFKDFMGKYENTAHRLSLQNASFEDIKQNAIQKEIDSLGEYLANEVGFGGYGIGGSIIIKDDERLKKSYLSKHITTDEIRSTNGTFGFWMDIGIHRTLSIMFESEEISQVLRNNPMVGARLGALAYTKLSWNATQGSIREVERFLHYPDFEEEFDEEKEVMDKEPWVVPITGSLHDDIRANYIAKQLRKFGFDDMKRYIFDLVDYFSYKQVRNWIQSGMSSRIFTPIPVNLTHKETQQFLLCFDEDYASKVCAENEDIFTERAVSAQKVLMRQARLGSSKIAQLLMGNDITSTVGTEPLYVPVRTASTSNEMCATDKALPSLNTYIMCSLAIDGIDRAVDDQLQGVFNPAAKERSLVEDIEDENCFLYEKLIYQSALLDRERLQFQELRGQIRDREKKKGVFVRTCDYQKLIRAADDANKQEQEISKLREIIQSKSDTDQSKIQKINNQAARIEKLERKIADLEKKLQRAEENAMLARQAEEESAEQVKSLQVMIDRMISAEDEQETGEELETDVFDNLNIVCVGGHQTWANSMKKLHENVKIFDADGPTPPDESIKKADALWIQSNCLAHRVFYKVVNIARANKVPIRYFSYAGHIQCKKQILEDTKRSLRSSAEQAEHGKTS